MTTCHTVHSLHETWQLAGSLAMRLLANGGGVVALSGDLGAGKTAFTQGMARALGITRPVTSPTFAIVSEYKGDNSTLIHMDLYRLHGPDDLETIGFHDYLERQAIIAIEWPERAGELLPRNAIHVTITSLPQENSRKIEIT